MACGDTLAAKLLVAAGHTVDEPCEDVLGWSPWCSSDDVDEWNKRVAYVSDLLSDAWERLVWAEFDNGLEPTLSAAILPTIALYKRMAAEVELPGEAQLMLRYAFGGLGESTEAIRRDHEVISLGACGIEQVHSALAVLGDAGIVGVDVVPILEPPTPAEDVDAMWGIPWYAWVGLGVAILGGVYIAGRIA